MNPAPERVVVVTGLSGSGKSLVERCFEDLGYFCVDNLPLSLLDPLLAELRAGAVPRRKVCIVLDIRNPNFEARFPEAFDRIKREIPGARLVFIDAAEDALIRRFSETRRPHPLADQYSLLEALREERRGLEEVRAKADVVVDTSNLSVHELREHILRSFRESDDVGRMVVSLTSFGYKFGTPYDSDLVFDVRFLANPHFVSELRPKTGEDPAVAAYIQKDQRTGAFLSRLRGFLDFLLPRYEEEGKSYLSIAVGCTGGKHRSVFVVTRLAEELKSAGYPVRVRHRDAARD